MSYDDVLDAYRAELEDKVNRLEEENEALRNQLSEAHRQIALLEEQLTHYYL